LSDDQNKSETSVRELFATQRLKQRLAARIRATSAGNQNVLDPTKWPEDLRDILAAIARALEGKAPLPSLIEERANEYVDALPGHIVSISYEPKGGSHPRRAIYRIKVIGCRLDGAWSYSPGGLHAALEAARDYERLHKS
jgi:hypothetical protein